MITEQKFLNTKQLAELIGFDADTLQRMRRQGGGPPFIRIGDGPKAAIRYRVADVEQWFAANTVGTSAADLAAHAHAAIDLDAAARTCELIIASPLVTPSERRKAEAELRRIEAVKARRS